MTALDEAVTEALRRGCRVQDRSEKLVTLIEPKQFDPLGCLLLAGFRGGAGLNGTSSKFHAAPAARPA